MHNRTTLLAGLVFILAAAGCSRSEGVKMGLSDLCRVSDAKTRSISPENFSGKKSKGGMATLKEGSAAHAARELGQGWKVNPFVVIKPGTTFTMAEMEGPGMINHIWMTPARDYRHSILRLYWDDEKEPSVEVPVGDFFASGWGWGNEPAIRSLAVCVNPQNGFNCYWQMPFRKKARITMENLSSEHLLLYYQVNYTLAKAPKNLAYFHAQFRRVNPLPSKEVYTILDGIKGKGQYVGTYIAHGANSPGWWGEGEIKFYMDGDTEFPTICGTGEEDYFCGSYGFSGTDEYGQGREYQNFTSPYGGFYRVKPDEQKSLPNRFGEYRWHIMDPIRFERDLKVTIQALGWQSEGRYLPLQDDMASVAYWYQTEPHNPFPALPSKEKLMIVDTGGEGK